MSNCWTNCSLYAGQHSSVVVLSCVDVDQYNTHHQYTNRHLWTLPVSLAQHHDSPKSSDHHRPSSPHLYQLYNSIVQKPVIYMFASIVFYLYLCLCLCLYLYLHLYSTMSNSLQSVCRPASLRSCLYLFVLLKYQQWAAAGGNSFYDNPFVLYWYLCQYQNIDALYKKTFRFSLSPCSYDAYLLCW